MQTSVLRYPKADRFVRVHASLQIACKGNACASALITFFEGWHNYTMEYQQYREVYNQMMKDINQAPIIDTSGWQYHTNSQLEEGLLNLYKIDTINKALSFLEDEMGFISTDVPERLRILYKTGRTRWFLLMTDKINRWFQDFELKTATLILPPSVPKAKIPSNRAKDVQVDKSDSMADKAATVFNYWRMYANHPKSVMDSKRLKIIIDRLREGFSMERLCYAIEGCLNNPYHQGENDNQQVYDSIELIFRSATDVERFIKYAKNNKVPPQKVLDRLKDENVLEGKSEPTRAPSALDSLEYSAQLSKHLIPFVIAYRSYTKGKLFANGSAPKLLPEFEIDFDLIWLRVEKAVEDSAGVFADVHKSVLTNLIDEIKEQLK